MKYNNGRHGPRESDWPVPQPWTVECGSISGVSGSLFFRLVICRCFHNCWLWCLRFVDSAMMPGFEENSNLGWLNWFLFEVTN